MPKWSLGEKVTCFLAQVEYLFAQDDLDSPRS